MMMSTQGLDVDTLINKLVSYGQDSDEGSANTLDWWSDLWSGMLLFDVQCFKLEFFLISPNFLQNEQESKRLSALLTM